MKVTIKDFQRIKNAEFTIEDITIIYGKSSQGKTSIFKAISAAVYGRKLNTGVRHGANNTSVILEDEQHVFTWMKDLTNTRFILDKESFAKTKGVPPDAYVKDLNMNIITLLKNKLRPHLLRGRDPLYILGDSPTEAAIMLAFLFGNEKFPELLKTISKSNQDKKKNILYVEGQINSNEKLIKQEKQKIEQLKNIVPYFDYIDKLENATKLTIEINDYYNELFELTQHVELLRLDFNKYKDNYDSIKIEESLSPELIKDLERDLDELVRLGLDMFNLDKELQQWESQCNIEIQPDMTHEIVEDFDNYNQRFKELNADVFVLNGELKKYIDNVYLCGEEINNIQSKLEDCPTCGTKLEGETLEVFLSHIKEGCVE